MTACVSKGALVAGEDGFFPAQPAKKKTRAALAQKGYGIAFPFITEFNLFLGKKQPLQKKTCNDCFFFCS
jgi:hypothetical protein